MRLLLLLAQLPIAAMVLYLDLLSAAALLWRRAPDPAAPRARFAVLVPAHDEELLLPRLLRSLGDLTYPRDLFDVHVVADNCTDRTAAVAEAGGAVVHERTDPQQRGKGYALRWLLARLPIGPLGHKETGPEGDGPGYDAGTGERGYDAVVILDADSVVAPDFLDVMNAHLERGDVAIQGYYGVLNADESPTAALRYVALALFNGLRPRGRDALGLSAGLRGNGMCFAASIVQRFGWEAFTLAEDAEFHLQLVAAGERVTYAGGTFVLAEMPVTLDQARSQNERWERGRLQMLRSVGPRLLADGLRRRDPVRLDALAEQAVPPLSVLAALAALFCAATALPALRGSGARRLARLVALGQAAYVLSGLRLVRAPARAYVALLRAPFYVLWKVWVYTAAALKSDDGRWVRTQRRPH